MTLSVTLLAKAPEPGRVKTRLAVSIGEDAACEIHEALALDVLDSLAGWLGACSPPGELVLALTGDETASARLGAPALALGARVERQAPGDLGEKVMSALRSRLDEGFQACLVLGSDAPLVGAELLSAAAAALTETDLVFVPAKDGGFVLIGASRLSTGALDGVKWGSDEALAGALAAAEAAGLSRQLVGSEEDVDDLEGLRRLSTRLQDCPERAPRTSSWLAGRQNLLRD